MEIGNEISHKIRSAIKAKLVELGSYVDDELPDYIMVMVANKKSKAQMTEDLNLFLGANTEIFTAWLHDVLSKLETATIGPGATTASTTSATTSSAPAKTTPEKPAEPSKKSKKSKKSREKSSHHKSSKRKEKDGNSSRKTSESDMVAAPVKPQEVAATATSVKVSVEEPQPIVAAEAVAQIAKPVSQTTKPVSQTTKPVSQEQPADAIISLNPETHDLFDEEINQENKKQVESKPKSVPSKSTPEPSCTTRTSPVVASPQATVEAIAASSPTDQVTKRTVEKTTVTRVRTTSAGATQSTITVVAASTNRKRKGPGSVVGQVIEDEEDVGPPPGKRVASTVELHRRPTLPVSKQANTSLLKKAVSAAQESTKDVATPALAQGTPVMVQTRPHGSQKRIKIIRTTSASGANKTLLVRAVHEANESTASTRPSVASVKLQQPQKQPLQPQQQPQQKAKGITLYSTSSRAEVPKGGLVSRSRLREVAERDYDTQEFMTVETTSAPQVQVEEYYADDEEQEEEMEAVVDSRHIFVENTPSRGRTNVARRAVEVQDQEMAYDRSSPDSDIIMVVESKPVADKHVVVQSREKPPAPRPVSPKFIVTLDGAPQSQSKNKKPKAKAAARIAPRMDITRTIDNSATQPPVETEYAPAVMTSYQDAYVPSTIPTVSEPELVYVPSQMSPTPQPLYSPTKVMTMVADVEQVAITRQMQLEEQAVLEQQQQQQLQSDGVPQRQPPSERCRFWPACKNGNDCPYVHPTAPCKTFPNCKFGDKCVFIHPNCKFDARCTKTNCPFTHASKRSPSAAAPPPRPVPRVPVAPPSRGPSQTVCKFFPRCRKMDCPFLHPKACRFGSSCTRSDCMFTHPQVATGAALRWSKDKHISERFAVKSSEQQLQQS